MRNYILKYLLICTIGLTSLTSCDSELDQYSNNSTPENQSFNDADAFNSAIRGAYTRFKRFGYYQGSTGSQLIIADIMSDNTILNYNSGGTMLAASNFSFSPDNAETTGLYFAAYDVISKANFVLKYVNNGVLTGDARNNMEAEARAIRAACHFDLVRAYCKIPTQSDDALISLGINYTELFDPASGYASRNLNVAQIYGKIISDLLYAADNITNTDISRFTKPAIYGLLSRVYLYEGDYENVIKYGNLSLALSPSVTTYDNFNSIWKNTNTDGVLFQISNSAAEGSNVGSVYNQLINGEYSSSFVADYDFYNSYADNDVRKSTYFTQSEYNGLLYNHITKWSSIRGMPPNVVPIKYLRSAEVLLNVAEASYRNGNQTTALNLLNELRSNRYSNYTAGTETGSSLLSAILKERRYELAYENDRWYTLKRLGLPVQRSGKGFYADGSGQPALEQTLPTSSFKWQWPLPADAPRRTGGQVVQNPGY